MIPGHPPEVGAEFTAWRLCRQKYQAGWDSGEGAYLSGARWNTKGRYVVYCSLTPATAILELAVHVGFKTLDVVPHVVTALRILDTSSLHVVMPDAVPNPNWLRPGITSAGQQAFGDDLLNKYPFVIVPSTVAPHSWNLLFDPARARGLYQLAGQERFALDTRLHPPSAIEPA